MARTALHARYVFPVAQKPIADGVVVIAGDRIVAVEPASRISLRDETIDLGNVAILPGFVNAHTHLEFSDLAAPLGTPGMAFPAWIRAVIAQRRTSASESLHAARCAAIARGLGESLRMGTTTIGEIASFHPQLGGYDSAQQHVTVFREWLGLSTTHVDAARREATELCDYCHERNPLWSLGFSPHAPYSTHFQIADTLSRLAASLFPVAMHLAESREELDLLQTHGGGFRRLLDELGVWNAAAIPRGARPLDYLQLLALAPRALVIHGNYLADDEIDFIAARSETMSVVYCPRTHAYFQHEPYSLAKMLARGMNMALGTDSRASNPDLSLLAEMRHVTRHHRDVSPEAVLEMGTLNGAGALGLSREVGSLEPGKRADLAVVALPDGNSGDPHELLFDSDLPNVTTYCGGVKVV